MQQLADIKQRKDVPFDAIKRRASVDYGVPIESIHIVSVEDGYGLHIHDDKCDPQCFREHDNSDWIVTVVYDGYHEAVYGVLNGEFELWLD